MTIGVFAQRCGLTASALRFYADSGLLPPARVPAAVAGPDMDLGFPMTTLYPAVGSAIGADLLIDLRGPENPATIRSADDGDLTALAMPASPET